MSSEELTQVAGSGSEGAPKKKTTVTVALSSFEKGIQVDIHCTVLDCDAKLFPGITAHETAVVAVGSVPIFNRSELREALAAVARSNQLQVELTFSEVEKKQYLTVSALKSANKAAGASPASSGSGSGEHHRHHASAKKNVGFKGKGGDEFDLESCSSDDDAADHVMSKLRRGKPASKGGDSNEAEEEQDEYTPENLMLKATQRIQPGCCIIILTQGINPAMYIEAAAKDNGVSVMCISGADRLKTKVRREEFQEILGKGLRSNVWIMFEGATKSISTLLVLAEALKEVKGTNDFHAKGRVFLLCEPHPHFPEDLLKGSITLRFRPHPTAAQRELEETMHDSRSRIDVLQGLKGTSKACKDEMLISFKPERKRVQIANTVDVVLLEGPEPVTQSISRDIPPHGKELDARETGLRLDSQYTACRGGESLISLAKISKNRYAVGNNTGHILMLDMNALPMMMFRPLKACIWDMNFASDFDFATACEDGTASVMNYDLRSREITTRASAKFESDVFAVSYVRNSPDSPIVSGGLANNICVLHSDRQQATHCATQTSIQVIAKSHDGNVLLGGGSGATSIFDPETATIVRTANKHQKKVPAACCIPNTAVTGSFDKCVRVWDMRDRFVSTHSLVMADVVTAVSIDGFEMCCCSGNSLYVWDIRNLKTVLDSRLNAWKGLTRGLAIYSETKNIVTASVDGVVRVWKY